MSVLPLSKLPDILEDILAGKRKVIAFDRPVTDVTRAMMQSAYSLLTKEYPTLTEAECDPGWKPLHALREESPDNVVIVVCGGTAENAWKKIAPYGDFPIIHFFTLDCMFPLLPALRALPVTYRRQEKRTTGRRGIVVRGQLMGESGIQAVQKIAADHPDDYIIVSTWASIADVDKERLESVCDCLVLNEQPVSGGIQSRNFQMACLQPGIRAAMKAGVEKILVARSDCLFTHRSMLDSFDALLQAFPNPAAHAFGQKGRLIVPDYATRYYMPYHVGDLFTYGWAEDVARFWLPVPYDEREMPDETYRKIAPVSVSAIARLRVVAEVYFTAAFMDSIGRTPLWTLEDGLSFYRDFCLTVNHCDVGMFWFRKYWYNRTTYAGPFSKLLTHQRWLALIASGDDLRQHVDQDIDQMTWADFTRG